MTAARFPMVEHVIINKALLEDSLDYRLFISLTEEQDHVLAKIPSGIFGR